jgi:hypothetical protein
MRRTRVILAALLAAGLCFATTATGSDRGRPGKSAEKKPDTGIQAVRHLGAALHLAEYGRKEKSAVALLAAAEQLAQAQPRSLKERDKGVADKLVKQGFQEIKMTPETLIAEARPLAGKEAGVLVAATEKRIKEIRKQQEDVPRGRIGGAFVGIFDMKPRGTFAMTLPFKGGQQGLVGARVMDPPGAMVRLTVSAPRSGWERTQQGSLTTVSWFQDEPGNILMRRENLTEQYLKVIVWTN